MDYDTDDIHSNDDIDLNEHELNDDDYKTLYDNLKLVKESLSSYNNTIPDLIIKQVLYDQDFDINDTVKILRKRYKKSMYTF